jgi:hypothetical protein
MGSRRSTVAAMSDLPEGFVVDQPHGLPEGFALDQPAPAKAQQPGINIPNPIIGGESFHPSLIGMVKGLLGSVQSGVTLPRDVYQGKVDPLSQEGIERAIDLTALTALPSAGRPMAYRAPGAIPTAAELGDATTQAYQKVHSMGLELKPQPVETLATQIEQELSNKGITPRNAGPIYDALGTLKNPPAGAVITSRGFDNLRKEMVQATQSSDGSMRTGGGTVIGALDNYLANLPQSHVISGDAQAAAAQFKIARENFKATKRMNIVEGKENLGELNSATANAGQNADNAMRQSFKQMIRPDKYGKTLAEKEGFNAEEIASINQIARGGPVNNTLRFLGKLAPTDTGKITANAIAGHFTGGMSLIGSAGALAAKLIADHVTKQRAASLLDLVASRSPLGQARAAMGGFTQLPQPRLPTSMMGLLALSGGLKAMKAEPGNNINLLQSGLPPPATGLLPL